MFKIRLIIGEKKNQHLKFKRISDSQHFFSERPDP